MAIASIYAPVAKFAFLEYDDVAYVLRNADLQEGLTWASVKAVFVKTYIASWHPVSMLTHALDVSLFGMDAGMHHVMNVVYHIINSLLVLFVWYRLTGDPYRSAVLAVLWAVHPQHVEPVAWISSRKDLVSTLFMLLALLAYHRYVHSAKLAWYGCVAVTLILGLLAKPMLVTLPFVLLLLDYWPLSRFGTPQKVRRAVIEKIPLFIICVIFVVVTQIVQSQGGAVRSLGDVPLGYRLSNIPVAYGHYFWKAFYPSSLSIFYPHPMGDVEPLKMLAGLALMAVVSAFALLQWRRRPFLIVGWLWFVGSLVPVIGIIQFGAHGMADRYTYIAHLGLFTAIVWLGGECYERLTAGRKTVLVLLSAGVVVLSVASARYVNHFRNDVVLFTHVEDAVGPSLTQIVNLGNGLMRLGAFSEALVVFRSGYHLRPMTSNVYNNAGVCYLQLGRFDLARDTFAEGAALRPADERASYNVQYAEARIAEADEDIKAFVDRLQQEPDDIDAKFRIATRLYNIGRLDEAEAFLLAVQDQRPSDPAIAAKLGDVYLDTMRPMESANSYKRALELNGDPHYLLYRIARALIQSGDAAESRYYLREAMSLEPPSLNAWMLSRRTRLLDELAGSEGDY